MNRILLFCVFCLSISSLLGANSPLATAQIETNKAPLAGDFLQFLDGSMLHGNLRSIEPGKGVSWEHPEATNLIHFAPTNVESIRFDNARAVTTNKALCKFRFQNGDEFFGNLAALDEQSATLETWFGKKIEAPRSSLTSITFLAKSFTQIYEGPTSADGWNFGRGTQAWQYRDGALVTSSVGTVGRDFKLPPSCSVEFDISWTGPVFELVIPFFTDAIDRFDYGNNSYMIHLRPNSANVQRVHSELGVMNLGRAATIPNPQRKNSYHIEIRANKSESMLAMLVDGVLLQKWKDEAGFSGKGSGLVFFSQHEGPTVKISNIKVSEWDGRFEDERPTEIPNSEDVLRLANRDRVNGTVGALRDGKLTVKASDTILEIPMPRVSQIFFSTSATNKIARQPWEIRASFAGGEKISFCLEKWDAQQVAGTSASLGKLSFVPKTIRQIQFNLDKTKAAETNAVDDWDNVAGEAGFTAVNDREDSVSFRNGDLLYGALDFFEADRVLRWNRSDASEPINFKPGELSEIRFRQQTNNFVSGNCRLHLSNGDQLEGKIMGIDAQKIYLETAFAGKMSIERKRVLMMVPLQGKGAVVYEGPTGLDGWTMGQVNAVQDSGVWSYKDGAFYATKAASIARDLKLPDVASIQFDLAWKGTFQSAIALYTSHLQPVNLAGKDSEPDFGGFYSLQINSLTAGLMMVKKDAPLRYLWQMPVPAFAQKNQAHMEIRVNKPKRTITVLIDGRIFKHVIETEEFAGSGTCMRFVHQGLGSLKLSNLRIAEWDGRFEEKPSNGNGETDLTKLRNDDRVIGAVESFKDGKFSIHSDNGVLEIPLERVKQVELAGKKVEMSTDDPTAVNAFFKNGQVIAFHLDRWDKNGIHASSPNFGNATFNPAAFSRIIFKTDEPTPAKPRFSPFILP